jgi:putative FmdB family regulatory protein
MPLYEYECDACGSRFELIRKFSDPPLTVCPKCGAEQVRKLVSSPAFQFKGSGWYVTDYAKKSDDSASSTSAAKAAAESKADTKSDTKSESKTESRSESSSPEAKPDAAKSGGAAADKPATPASTPTKDKST